MKVSKLRSALYRAARLLGDLSLVQGDRHKAQRRAKNKLVGRLLGPFWRKLWR